MAKINFNSIKTELKTHWKTPDTQNGKYVSWKEQIDIFISVAMNYGAQAPLKYIGFSATCFLIMYHYNLPYLAFSVIALIGVPLSYLWNLLDWQIADNLGFLQKKAEVKFYAFYITAFVSGLILLIADVSRLWGPDSSLIIALNGIEGINARSFFKIIGVQLLTNGFAGARNIFWRKLLVPKYGRYKYSLYGNVIQKCIMIVLIGWLPIYNIKSVDERVWLAYLLFSLFTMYDFSNRMEACTSVISPNSSERLFVRTYTVKVSHLLNSILVAVIPLLGKFEDINFYKFVIPAVFIPMALLTVKFAGRVTERIPQPPIEKKQPIPFWYGIFQVMRNKYNWLNTASGILDSLGNGMLDIETIIMIYLLRLGGLEYSLIGLLWSFRTTIPTFLAPYFIKKYKFKHLRIFRQIVHIIACSFSIAALWFLYDNYLACGIIIFIVQFLNTFLTYVSRNAEMDMDVRLKDYQMYLSGERIENMTNVFSWFSSPITNLVGLIIPVILLANGFNSNWDILFLDSARFNILAIPFMFDLVGHIFIVIPYLFWDYNKDQHEYVIDVLKQREALANEGFFPQTYEGGLDFEKPEAVKNGIPTNIDGYIERKQALLEKSKGCENLTVDL